MTRDEAIHKITATTPAYSGASSMWLVDSLAILGLLKFDAPTSVSTYKRAADALRNSRILDCDPYHVFRVLEEAGFDVIERKKD